LIVNASTVLHLNKTATEYAYHLVKTTPKDSIARQIAFRYNVSKSQALVDFDDFQDRIFALVNVPDLDPVTFLEFERDIPYSGEISAPYRLDCALTYRLPEGIDPEFAPTKRVDRELTTDEWKTILDKAWNAGIPHVVFTGGEPTLREDLLELIYHAEELGQVTGLLTDGVQLTNEDYLHNILQTGLDHLMVLLQPKDEESWHALEKVLPEDIYTTVHFTVTSENIKEICTIIDRLDEVGATSISLSDIGENLDETMEKARNYIAELDIALDWDLPVPYSPRNPVTLEVDDDEADFIEGAGRAWMYIEPDGDVLPAQEINKVMGNLLSDDWKLIWENTA